MSHGGTLLDRVIEGASGAAPVTQLLRQLKVLASRTDTPVLQAWVDHELNGYPDDVDVPEYRGPFAIRPMGHFIGAMGASADNVEIPPSTFPEQYRDRSLFRRIFDEPIVTIEERAKVEFTTFGWDPDVISWYRHATKSGEVRPVLRENLVLAEVRFHVPGVTFGEIVDAVRSKILDLTLELERVAPLAGQSQSPPEQAASAAAVINNHFHAAANVAIGAVGTTQLVVSAPDPGDADSLLRFLAAAGLPADQLLELEAAIGADREESPWVSEGQRWSRTRAWLARAATDAGTGALGGFIATAAAGFLG